jgi:hypothetical protein
VITRNISDVTETMEVIQPCVGLEFDNETMSKGLRFCPLYGEQIDSKHTPYLTRSKSKIKLWLYLTN